jgi:opacity protein-like surface antigen
MSVVAMALPLVVFGGTGIGEKPFSFGPRATYSTPKEADSGQWYAGAQGRLHMSSGLAVEGSIDYRRNNYGRLTSIKTYPVQVSLLAYIIPDALVSPFLLGGGGWYYTMVDGPAGYSNTESRFGMHAGAGLELAINEYMSLDTSYRYVWLETVRSKDEDSLYKSFDDSGSMVTIAFNFLF